MEIPNAFVCPMGIGTVFIGLLSLVVICKVTSFFCKLGSKKEQEQAVETKTVANQTQESVLNKQELIVAISAAVAEELGTDVSAIRILSFKKCEG